MSGDYYLRNIPVNSELWEYLSGKDETTSSNNDNLKCNANFQKIREPYQSTPKILLIMPPAILPKGGVKRVIPPLGILYVAGYLESRNISCDILDCVVEAVDNEECLEDNYWRLGLSDEKIRHVVLEGNYDVVGISVLYSSDLPSAYNVAKIVKEAKNSIYTIAGGIHPTIYPKEVLTKGKEGDLIDFVIRGEGEIRFYDFIRNLKEGVIDINSDGLCGWLDGAIFINHQKDTIKDLDSLPFPAYYKLPMEKYFQQNVPFSPFPRGKRVMQIYTSRGCPIGCTFCASTNFNKLFRSRSVKNVIEEIQYYIEEYDIDEIQFADDNLTLNKIRAQELFRALKEVKISWCTPNGIMVNTLTEELIYIMAESGLYQITLSIDSGNAKTLKESHHKPVNLGRLPILISLLRKLGVLIHTTLVIGMPNESKEDIAEGFSFVEKLDFDSIAVFIAQPIPGSTLFEVELIKGNISKEASLKIDTGKSTIKLANIDANDLEKMANDFVLKYNSIIKQRDLTLWKTKYERHLRRLKDICIGGTLNHNIAGIANA